MPLFEDIFATAPDFVNDAGIKWWLDRDLSRYAADKGLADTRVWLVEEVNGRRTRVVTQGNVPVFENQRLEDVAVHLDIMALAQEAEEANERAVRQ